MKKMIFCVSLIALTMTLFAVQNCHAANLLMNPGFEKGDFPPDNWDDWSGSESDNPERNGVAGFPAPAKQSHSGNKGVGKILYGSGKRWGGFSQTFDITGGRRFAASGWVKNNKNDGAMRKGTTAHIEVKFLDGNDDEIKIVKSNSIRQSTRWIKLSARGVIPGNAEKAVFSFVLLGRKGSVGKVLFDDAAFEIDKYR